MSRITPLLTDQYQFAMVYAYYTSNRHMEPSAFEMFFRTNPFKGTYAIFAGLGEFMDFLVNFHFTDEEIEFLHKQNPYAGEDFFDYLKSLNYKQLTILAPEEGRVVYANEPLICVEGPLGFCQLIETTLLVLCNYATLVTTNACRMRVAVETGFTEQKDKNPLTASEEVNRLLQNHKMLEFGLRRAQGPNGGLSASRYALMGGFNSTSNVEGARQNGIIATGTMAHAFILSHTKPLEECLGWMPNIIRQELQNATFEQFATLVLKWKEALHSSEHSTPLYQPLSTSQGSALPVFSPYRGNATELTAFAVFAYTQPSNFFALIDTYDTLNSGMVNFLIVSCALMEYGVQSNGVRLDSGDLAYLSRQCKMLMIKMDEVLTQEYCNISPSEEKRQYGGQFKKTKICASNDITEEVIVQLHKDSAEIDIYGIGTHLVTCKAQPALGGVYKLVEIDGQPRMKMTEDIGKATLPGAKDVYRLFLANGEPYVDVIYQRSHEAPKAGQVVTCIHPTDELQRVMIKPSSVLKLHRAWLENGNINYNHTIENGIVKLIHPPIETIKHFVLEQVFMMRADHKRYLNPTPYKVSLDEDMNKLVRSMAIGCKTIQLIQ